jgi:DNA-binding transcriptional MerR regulator
MPAGAIHRSGHAGVVKRSFITSVEQMSIGEFARRSRLSPKALRLYDELGLLVSARVDASSGYRFYAVAQLEQARFVAAPRQLQMPLADIQAMLALEPEDGATRIAEYWAAAETEHADQRQLVEYLLNRIHGKRSVMYEVETREIPSRTLLCLKRNVDGQAGAWALGQEFVAILRERPLPRMEGRQGAAFSIYWGEANDDSDGPIEWYRPIPDEHAEVLVQPYPELTLRNEPAHKEAFVDIGPGGQTSQAQWQLVTESLRSWAEEHDAEPSDLGVRVTFLASEPDTESSAPDCDSAVPII